MVKKGSKASPNQLKGLMIGWKNKDGVLNPAWKGDNVGYGALHNWIKRHKIKKELCECCDKEKTYDLANISGKYKRDINDWEWLCRGCHMNKDGRLNNLHRNKIITPEEKKARLKEYAIKNRDKIRMYHRKYDMIWYYKNKDKILARGRELYAHKKRNKITF